MIFLIPLAIFGYFGFFANIYVVSCFFLISTMQDFADVSSKVEEKDANEEEFAIVKKFLYKNSYVKSFQLLSISSFLTFLLYSIVFYLLGIYTALILPFFCLPLLSFTLMSIGVIFFEEESFNYRSSHFILLILELIAFASLSYFGIFLNIYLVSCFFLLNISSALPFQEKLFSDYEKSLLYKNSYVRTFRLLSISSFVTFLLYSIVFYLLGIYTALILPFFCLSQLFFAITAIGVIFFEEEPFNHNAALIFSSIVGLISILVYANVFGFLNYFTSPFSLSLYFLPVIFILGIYFNPFCTDEKGQTILFGTFKVPNWDKFLFAFVVQASFVVLLCFRDHPELLTLLFGIPTLPYIYGVILLMPLVYLHASLSEFVFTGLPLLIHRWLSSNDSEMMIKIGCCFLSVVLFALLHMGSFPFTLLGILHCFAITLPTSVTLLAITFYSGGVEYSLGLRYAITLLSLILFPGAISGSLVASVSLMQVCWAFLDAALKLAVPVLLVFFYEMTYYRRWAYGSNVIEKEARWAYGSNVIEKKAMKIYLDPFKYYCKKRNLKVIGAHGYQLFYDILTGLNISSENGWNVFYRQASLVFHPDMGGEEKHFKSLNGI
ncbi:MAG: hypothetical protein HON78_00795, partial [Legionellales bacterium]|nr:hypothetical protein [Legionellales bacterium]